MVNVRGIQHFKGTNKIGLYLRFVNFEMTTGHQGAHIILDKNNVMVGCYDAPSASCYISENFKDCVDEIKKHRNETPAIVPHEELLRIFGQNFANLVQAGNGQQKRCKHLNADIKGLTSAPCPDCGEKVTPFLVMCNLVTHMGEINENMWEKQLNKEAKVAAEMAAETVEKK